MLATSIAADPQYAFRTNQVLLIPIAELTAGVDQRPRLQLFVVHTERDPYHPLFRKRSCRSRLILFREVCVRE